MQITIPDNLVVSELTTQITNAVLVIGRTIAL